MNMKKLLIAAMLAGSLGSITAAPAISAVVIVRQAPPEPRSERVPAPRRGYVWAPGHWEWKHGNHVWQRGHWVRERRGYVYREPVWRERDGRWVMTRGGWERQRERRDRDGDGVPNRHDDRPNNPNRS
jgi:hypothetical protein